MACKEHWGDFDETCVQCLTNELRRVRRQLGTLQAEGLKLCAAGADVEQVLRPLLKVLKQQPPDVAAKINRAFWRERGKEGGRPTAP